MPFPPLVEPVAALSPAETARTARHATLVPLGELGQRRLAAAHIAIVGAGGLGSPAILALAAAGVGTLTVIDDDVVEASNLQRQVMHRLSDVGALKTASAERVAAGLSETRIVAVTDRLTPANAESILADADVVLDGSDTFDTREVVAAACEALGSPLVWGTVQEFGAQVTVFWSRPPAGTTPVALGDLYPTGGARDAPTCAAVGVLGAMCLQVGALMATEAIKLIAGIGDPLLGRVLVIDALRARQREVPLRGRADAGHPDTPADPTRATPATGSATHPDTPGALGRAAAPAVPGAAVPAVRHITVREFADRPTTATVLDVREADEVARGAIPGARHVPLAEVLGDPAALAPDAPYIVVCQAGARARRAAEALAAAGIDSTVLAGGMDAWQAALTEARS